jgi:hypothetical protein
LTILVFVIYKAKLLLDKSPHQNVFCTKMAEFRKSNDWLNKHFLP